MKTSSRLPNRIDRDGLYNAIVNLSINTDYNARFLIKVIMENLNTNESEFSDFAPVRLSTEQEQSSETIYIANKNYRIMVSGDMISFNIVSAYRGWNEYRRLVLSVLEYLERKISVQRISVRYTSAMEDESVFENLDGEIELYSLPSFAGSEFKFSCKINDDSINNGIGYVHLIDRKKTKDREVSFVDITTEDCMVEGSLLGLEKSLDCLHFHEKNLFFLILSENFIKSRNPIY